MTCQQKLLKKIDESVADSYFPAWDCGEAIAVVGAMRASGFHSRKGAALVFESFEYSLQENVIQCRAFCFSTFEILKWFETIDSIRIHLDRVDGKPRIGFGEMKVESQSGSFSVRLEKKDLVKRGYLRCDSRALTAEALLLKIVEVAPHDWLFGKTEDLKKEFGMPDDAARVFTLDHWEHPSFEQLYGDEKKGPGDFPDIRSMIEAVCKRIEHPVLGKTPNTSWQQQCKKQAD